MNKEMKKIMEEIGKLEYFDLKIYYDYVSKYGKNVISDLFNYIFKNSNDMDKLYNKYFMAYLDIELENYVIDDDTFIKLSEKYGEDNVTKYFNELLSLSDNPKKVKDRYEKIYFYMDEIILSDDNKLFDGNDSYRRYLSEVVCYDLLTAEEERKLILELIELRDAISIATFDDYDVICLNDVIKILSSIKTREQFMKLKKIKDKVCDNDKKVIINYIDKNNKYFRENEILENNLDDIYNFEYLSEQLDKMIRFISVKEKIINSNLRLVISIARRYVCGGVDLLDLISEGNIGLMKAIRKFDGSRNTKISTYATWWIRQVIVRYVADNSRTIRVPVHFNEKIYKYNKAIRTLYQTIGDVPSDEILSDYLGWSLNEVLNVKEVVNNNNILSLNSVFSEEENFSLNDILTSDFDTEDEYYKIELNDKLEECLNELPEREATIVRYRFGFYSNREYTLEEVGKMFGVTRERIRQIESKVLRKLRYSIGKRNLEGYYTLKKTI